MQAFPIWLIATIAVVAFVLLIVLFVLAYKTYGYVQQCELTRLSSMARGVELPRWEERQAFRKQFLQQEAERAQQKLVQDERQIFSSSAPRFPRLSTTEEPGYGARIGQAISDFRDRLLSPWGSSLASSGYSTGLAAAGGGRTAARASWLQ